MALVYFFCVQDFICKIFIMYYLYRLWVSNPPLPVSQALSDIRLARTIVERARMMDEIEKQYSPLSE